MKCPYCNDELELKQEICSNCGILLNWNPILVWNKQAYRNFWEYEVGIKQ